MSATDAPYAIALAAYALREDAWGLGPEERGPSGWGAVMRRGDHIAEFRMHSCGSTRREVLEAGRGLLEQMVMGAQFAFVDAPGAIVTDQGHRDLERARELAKQAALIPHEPLMQVIK